MSENLSPIEEQALDALLAEAHDQATPPDLSSEILARLAQHDHQAASDSGISITSSPRGRESSRQRSTGLIVALFAAVAASIAVVIWIQGADDVTDASKIVQNTPRPEDADLPKVVSAQQPIETIDPQSLQPRQLVPESSGDELRGLPMVVHADVVELPTTLIQPRVDDPETRQLPPIDQVARSLAADWTTYWNAMGTQPTAQASASETAARLSSVLGAELSADAFTSPVRLRTELAADDIKQQIAFRWLTQITEGGFSTLREPQQVALAGDIASHFGEGFDGHFAQLLSGESNETSAFYGAMSAGGHDAMVRRLAAVAMNVDLRCTKCHDAKIQRSGQQEAYWSFASFVRKGLKRSRDGVWSVLAADNFSGKPSFYELPDGRQRFVEPRVDPSWMKSDGGGDIATWSGQLSGSPELARGLVNSLWKMVYGRQLTGRVIDTVAAPYHQKLAAIEQQLSDDLVRSGFDISRTLALVLSSPVARRSVPEPLLPSNALTASDAEIRSAMDLVESFAAAVPGKSSISVRQRVEVAMKSMGKSLRDLEGQESLANIASPVFPQRTESTRRKGDNSKEKAVGALYPYRASSLPVQWLAGIEDYESRVNHLGYLAGMSELPGPLREASTVIRKAGGSEELALQRVWWLLQP